jgi:hypothetical protein
MSNITGYGTTNQVGITSNKFDFYSGSQITVWFGNVNIDDINSIQWVRANSKTPIYGYASQLHDAVANGLVTIQGTFTINFRQKGYLSAVIQSIRDLYDAIAPTEPGAKAKFNTNQWPMVQQILSSSLRSGTFGPQTMAQIQEIGNNQDFTQLSDLYRSAIWQHDIPQNFVDDAVDVHQTEAVPDGFDIVIQYGNSSHSQLNTMNDRLHSTTKTLHGVHITGEAQSIRVGGEPIQEQYSFIARNTDE